jgi:hypothetical protein
MDEMSIVWRGKLLAFAMGMLPRLGGGQEGKGRKKTQRTVQTRSMGRGEGSLVFGLKEGLFGMIAEAYWGQRSTPTLLEAAEGGTVEYAISPMRLTSFTFFQIL